MTIIALRLAEAKVGTEGDAELILHRILAYLTPVQDSATLLNVERLFKVMMHQHSQRTYFRTCSCSERA